jgi:RNA polymerase sigma-70 factor, ECF subfamily
VAPPQRDELSSFEALYRAYYYSVRDYARRRIGAACDDVAAEVFTAAWRQRERLEEIDLRWLLRAAHNEVLHEYRTNGRQERLTKRLTTLDPPRSDDDPIDQVIDAVDATAAVAAAMALLSAADQELLRLVAWEQLPPRDVAAVVGCSAAAARVRIHRASRRLARLMSTPSTTAATHVLGRVL